MENEEVRWCIGLGGRGGKQVDPYTMELEGSKEGWGGPGGEGLKKREGGGGGARQKGQH